MAPPSLKKMEGQTKEGIYASSNKSCKGKIHRNDPGLTLFPGSQTQREGEGECHLGSEETQQGRDFLKELRNGSKKEIVPRIGRYTLRGKVNQEVLLQARAPDHGQRGLDKSTRSRLGEITHIHELESDATAAFSSTRLSSPAVSSAASASKRKSSKSCTVTAVVSGEPLFSAHGDGGCKAIELAPSLFQTVGVKDVGFFGSARKGESDAEDNLDISRPHKRQRMDIYVPSEEIESVSATCIDRLKRVENVTERTWSRDVAVISSGQNGVMRSRSHGPTNEVVRLDTSLGCENHYREPRATSLPAPEAQARRLSISNFSHTSLDHPMVLSSNSDPSYMQHLTGKPASPDIQSSTAFGTSMLRTRSPIISRRSLQMPRYKASELRTADLSDTSSSEDYSDSRSHLESAQSDETIPEGRFESATATSSHDHHDVERDSESSDPPVLSALPENQSNLSEAFATASSNTTGLAQTQFTSSHSWQAQSSIDRTISSNDSSDGATTQASSQRLDTSLQHGIKTFPKQDAYQSPYALQPHVQEDQMTDSAIHDPNARDHFRTLTTGLSATVSHPSVYSTSQSPGASAMNPSTQLPPRLESGGMQNQQQCSNTQIPALSPHQELLYKTGTRVFANSEQSSSAYEEALNEGSTEERLSPRKEILLPPELIGPAKKAIDAVCPVLLERLHHADIVPRVLSFVKTFSLPDDAPFTADDVSPANLKDLNFKNQSLRERNADLIRERDKYRRAAGDWTTVDPTTGQTKGQTMSRELRHLRSELSKKKEEVEEFRKAWAEFDAARAATALTIDTSAAFTGALRSRTGHSLHTRRVGATMQSIQVASPSGSTVMSPAAGPTPPASQRVSIDLTEGTSPPSSISSAPLPSLGSNPAPSPEAARLHSTMKRKTYSWLPSEANHMAKKSKPAARGSQPSTPIEIDAASPVIDADAELEAELERELLASQQVDEREQQKAATYERQKAMQKEKRDSMKLARERAKQKQQGRARAEREAKERRQKEVEEEQRRKEAEDRAFEEELFGPEVVVGCGDDGENNDTVGQQREADVFMGYMPENQIAGPTMYGVLEESSEDSEEE